MQQLSKQDLLHQIRTLMFTCADLNLFLDTHPDNAAAGADYACYSARLIALKREYETRFGPLMNFGNSLISDSFPWTECPWPWTGEEV
ncbi:MAG: spore coat protein CotJB [Clostridia bacterium]|nr:spore coat protein CotJB [Clostridia bacterium]